MGLPFLFADSLRIGSTIIFPYRVLFGRIFLLVGMIIHGAMRTVSVFLGLCENASLKQKEGIALYREEPFGDVF